MFSFLFFSISFCSLLVGVYFLDGFSLVVEFFLPYSFFNEVSLSFCFDYVSMLFFSVVSLISGCVFIYSKYYMGINSDFMSDSSRFLYVLFLFVVSMFFLVFSFSWVSVMIGWDGLGLVSFLLVIYYNDVSSLNSGLVTVFTNRVGDCFFILSFLFMFYCGWVSVDFMGYLSCLIFSLFIIGGCLTKSAQFPFSSWLPMAMAAPTPVSSLVHSSTLVTAGVYLLVRFNYFFYENYLLLSYISLFTMFFSGLCAIFELDFKKVVAMSTLSQLGFMVFSFSMGMWYFCYFHMMFHAFFKSILFLSTGSLMHNVVGAQDSRYFGGFFESFYSKLFFSMSCLSLMGFPFSLGFYSKDSIIGGFIFNSFGFMVIMFFISCCFSVCYSIRLLNMGFCGCPSFYSSVSFGESSFFYFPVFVLFLFCVFSGNFLFLNFFPPTYFSLVDYLLGLFVIVGGLSIYSSINFGYFLINHIMCMFFLSPLSSSGFSRFFTFMDYKDESFWGELVGAKGVGVLLNFSGVNSFGLYKSYFFNSLLFVFIFVFMVVVF